MNTPNISEIRDENLVRSNSSLNVHEHLKGLSVEELQNVSKQDRLPWHTLCLNVTGDLNVGTIIRTSHCLGATSVTVFGRQKIDNRSLVGAANYITVHKVRAIDDNFKIKADDFREYMESRNLTPVFVEAGGIDLPFVDWRLGEEFIADIGNEICLIMGNEGDGIPEDILDLKNHFRHSFVVSIPQRGVIRSLNVGVAHAIVAGAMCEKMGWM